MRKLFLVLILAFAFGFSQDYVKNLTINQASPYSESHWFGLKESDLNAEHWGFFVKLDSISNLAYKDTAYVYLNLKTRSGVHSSAVAMTFTYLNDDSAFTTGTAVSTLDVATVDGKILFCPINRAATMAKPSDMPIQDVGFTFTTEDSVNFNAKVSIQTRSTK